MRHASTRSVRVLSVAPIAISIVFTSTLAGAAFFPIAASAVSASALPLDHSFARLAIAVPTACCPPVPDPGRPDRTPR